MPYPLVNPDERQYHMTVYSSPANVVVLEQVVWAVEEGEGQERVLHVTDLRLRDALASVPIFYARWAPVP